MLRTPGKRKTDSFAGEEFEGLLPSWKNQKYERALPEDSLELELIIDEGVKKGVLTTAVSKIETFIQDMGQALTEVTAIHHDRLFTLEDNVEVIIRMFQTLKSRIGSSVNIGDRFIAPNLWGSTAFIADDLSKVTEDLAEMHASLVIPMKESMASLDVADAELNAKCDKVVRDVKLLLS